MRVLPTLLTAASMTFAVGCSGGAPSLHAVGPGANYFAPGERVHAATLSGALLEGGRYTSANARGHILVVNVWGSWCGPCREEAPALAAAARELSADGVSFVGVDTEDVRSAALKFVRGHGLPYPSVFDPDGRIKTQYRYPPIATPTTYVIDPAGRIAAVNYGKVSEPQLLSLVHRVAVTGKK